MLDWMKAMRDPKGRHRPVDLKRSLLLRIAVVASACFALVTTIALVEMHQDARRRAAETADLIVRQLELQLFRINTGFDLSNRFPDWETIVGNGVASGQCVRYYDAKGEMQRANCVGFASATDPTPAWFAAISGLLFAPGDSISRSVSYKDTQYGNVVVTSSSEAVTQRIWRDIKLPLILTFLTIISLSISVYVALSRALAPTQQLVAGLNRLASGELSYRLPSFKLAELQRISEVANELAANLQQMLAERAELSTRLVNTQEDERRHLARELHDEFGQNLTAIAALAASIKRTADESCPELRLEARSLSKISMHMMNALRGTLLRLRPADFDKFGLAESLRQLVDVWRASRRRQTRFELDIPAEITLPDNTAIHVFRIAQEGLTNAAKHAGASRIRLSVEPVSLPEPAHPDAVGIRLTIEDDGDGRPAGETSLASGRGLINMQERVAALGGTIAIDTAPGFGLKVQVVVPVVAEEKAGDEPTRH
jgi:two-component system, NarL family, sensor histidine kinase UhpB